MLLESKIDVSLRTLLLRIQKTAYPDPNESTLLTLPTSASTLRSLPVAQGNSAVEEPTTLLSNARKIEADTNTITIESGEELIEPSVDDSEILSRKPEVPSRKESGDVFESESTSTKNAGGVDVGIMSKKIQQHLLQ